MVEQFDKEKHKKTDIIKDAVRALGVDAPNDALKTWINERYRGFTWSGNPSVEFANGKKAVQKETDAEPVTPRPVKGPKATPAPAPRESPVTEPASSVAGDSAGSVTPGAVIKALKRIAAMPADERAALDKALKAIQQFGSADAAQNAIKKVTDLLM